MSEAARHAEIERLLRELRDNITGWQDLETPRRVAAIRALQPDIEQLLELEALAQFALIGDEREAAQRQLGLAQQLQQTAQQLGATRAEAAAWRLMHGLQSLLHQHQAALYSAGTAAALYQRCEEAGLALAMQVSRNNVLFHLELFSELLESCERLIAAPEGLSPAFLHRVRNGAGSACFSLANEARTQAERREWLEQALLHHQAGLALSESAQLPLLGGMSRINLCVVHAMLGRLEPARAHLECVRQLPQIQGGRPGWPAWLALSAALIDAQDPRQDAATSWQALVALSQQLGEDSLNNGPAHESCLHAIRWLGPERGHDLDALRATRRLLGLARHNKQALAQALGETIGLVLAKPRLEQQQQQLLAQGSALEQALAQRNAELSRALAKLQAEATIRQSAEAALRQAHDELELRVQQRSAELHQASRTLLLQEKQLHLSQLLASSAEAMGEPLQQARAAAEQLGRLEPGLLALLQAQNMRRTVLSQCLEQLEQQAGIADSALQTLAQQVQRFKALETPA